MKKYSLDIIKAENGWVVISGDPGAYDRPAVVATDEQNLAEVIAAALVRDAFDQTDGQKGTDKSQMIYPQKLPQVLFKKQPVESPGSAWTTYSGNGGDL